MQIGELRTGGKEVQKAILIMDYQEAQLLMDMASEYCERHKRRTKAKRLQKTLEDIGCF